MTPSCCGYEPAEDGTSAAAIAELVPATGGDFGNDELVSCPVEIAEVPGTEESLEEELLGCEVPWGFKELVVVLNVGIDRFSNVPAALLSCADISEVVEEEPPCKDCGGTVWLVAADTVSRCCCCCCSIFEATSPPWFCDVAEEE